MTLFRKGLSISLIVGLSAVMMPTQAWASSDPAGDILVAGTIHELPAPAVAMASDGRALVVYQDAAPGDTSGSCTSNGGVCPIVAKIVDADGVTVGAPFVVSSSVEINFYYAGPSVTWNNDLGHWLVVFTSIRSGFEGVYAQRVAADGTLLGAQVQIPTALTTPADDRSVDSAGDLTVRSIVKASATWSTEDQAYLIAWYGSNNALTPVTRNSTNVFGYLANGDLQSVDGLDASFILSDDPAHNRNVEVAYSSATGQWMVLWSNRDVRQAHAQAVSLTGTTFSVSPSTVVVSASGAGYQEEQFAGGVAWVSSTNSWLFSWGARPTGETNWQTFGRTMTGNTLGTIVSLSDFSALPDAREVLRMMSQQLYYDAATDTIHAVATGDTTSSYSGHMALQWTLDPQTLVPTAATWLRHGTEPNLTSSRIRITSNRDGIAVVYQNWTQGSYQDAAEVRYVLQNAVSVPPIISVNEAEVAPGGEVTVTGSGFAPNSSVVIELRSGSTTLATLATVQSDVNGEINAVVEIPTGTAAGEYEIRATDSDSGLFGSAAITVTPMLAVTGAGDTMSLGLGAAGLLALGLMMVVAVRRSAVQR